MLGFQTTHYWTWVSSHNKVPALFYYIVHWALGKNFIWRTEVVAQLIERLLPTAEIRGSNSVIGKFYLLSTVGILKMCWKDKGGGKEAGNGPLKISINVLSLSLPNIFGSPPSSPPIDGRNWNGGGQPDLPKSIMSVALYIFDWSSLCRSTKSSHVNSVTRWLDYFSTFGHLHQWKFAQSHTKFAKEGTNIYQMVNIPLKIAPKTLKIFLKVSKFRQIWSHCWRRLEMVLHEFQLIRFH